MLMSEASNMALKFLTQGGVYLSGGFLSSNKDILLDNRIKLFEKFIDKGRFKNILENIPLILLTQNDIGARGSAIYSTRFQS